MTVKKLLGTKYNEYDITDLNDVNPYYQDIRKMNETQRKETAEKIRKKLFEKWDVNRQPLGGGKKTDEQIIKDFKSLTTLDHRSILDFDHKGTENVLRYFGKAPSGINQYFPEMLDTPISLGRKSISVMDVIKDKDTFQKFFESIVYKDRMYAFTMWYGGNKANNFFEAVPQETLDLLGEDIPNDYSVDSTDVDKRFKGYKLPLYFYHEDSDLYYKLDMNGYKSHDIKTAQIKYVPCDKKDYDNNMRIFPNITQSFRLGGGSQPVSNFSAGIAHFLIVHTFENSIDLIENDTFVVLDTSSGWAGRMVGLLSCYTKMRDFYKEKTNKELTVAYLTTDPNEEIADRYEVIRKDWFSQIEPNADSTHFHLLKSLYGSETPEFLNFCKTELKKLNVKGCTMGLTSPPYFNREQYSKGTTQSYMKYGSTYESWSEGFLKPTINIISQLMVEGGVFYMNIANINTSKELPLEEDTIKYGTEYGFSCSKSDNDVFKMLMSTMVGNNKSSKGTGSQPKNSVELPPYGKLQKFEPIFKLKKIKLIPQIKIPETDTNWFNEL